MHIGELVAREGVVFAIFYPNCALCGLHECHALHAKYIGTLQSFKVGLPIARDSIIITNFLLAIGYLVPNTPLH